MIYVHYVKDCCPKLKKFRTRTAAFKFIKKFSKTMNEDSCIEFMIEGELLMASDEYIKGGSCADT